MISSIPKDCVRTYTWTDQQMAPKVPRTLAAIGTSMIPFVPCCKAILGALGYDNARFGASIILVGLS